MNASNPSFFDHDMEMIPENTFKSIIKVIGIGGGGSNAVKHMKEMEIKGADLVICNTDSQALASNPVQTKIKLGQQGLGAGTDPEVGRQAALESREKIQQVLSNDTQMVFITAGMGGGTGTGAAPVIAEIARERNLLTVAVVTAPYKWEGRDKIFYAMNGVEALKSYCDTVIVVMNDKLAEHYENLPMSDAFSKADDVLAKAVKSVVDVIAKPGDINTDFMDVKKVLTKAGQAMMSSAFGEGDNRAFDAIEEALKSPLLNSQEIKGAKRILVTVSTGSKRPLLMKEQNTIITYLNERIYAQADMVKFGYSSDEELGESLYLTVIAAGFEHEEDGFGGYFEKPASTYSGVDELGEHELAAGHTVTFEGESAGNIMNEEARFAYMVEQYVNGGPSEREFDVPTYRRNAAKLISIDSLRRDEWVVTDLYEN
jgi:cell division protein FtsZ